jgi:RimJ/RimL family protein N-acetyltransferase
VIPTIETERLVLRGWTEADLDPLAAMYAQERVVRYLGNAETATRDETWRAIAMMLGHWELRGYGPWAVEERMTGSFVGRIGLFNPEGWPGLEVGWVLAPDHWGKGYATEGARATLDWAFGTLDVDHVISLIHPENVASIRVAERVGETSEGTTDFRGHELLVYGISAPTVRR